MMIPFNKPFMVGKELHYIEDSILSGKISGDGKYTQLAQNLLQSKFNYKKVLLTTSCTDALEMSAIMLDIKKGDEVIIPSYTFVSTANAFELRGAKVVFADSQDYNPNIDIEKIEELITNKTRAIVLVHYAGISCDFGRLRKLIKGSNIEIIEDAAQSISSYYNNSPLGGIGRFGTLSFHETKNIISGEGGALIVNNEDDLNRCEIIREKGTNRSAFFRGHIDKYGWVDIGSSFLPSDIIAAYLFAQLEKIEEIQKKRMLLWNRYMSNLGKKLEQKEFEIQNIPKYATNNAHMYYFLARNINDRDNLLNGLKKNNINAVFHYQSLHKSEYFYKKHDGRILSNSDKFSDRLIRLPLYYDLTCDQVDFISEKLIELI